LGWNAEQVSNILSEKLSSKSVAATRFDLERYDTNERLKLTDLKGKVVLVTYWFPGCGPCRGEFPHFENVLKKFNREDVAYVGINIAPKEDPYVLPFMKSTGHSFIPVRDEPEKRGNLPARGAPTNYLIDGNGNILYKDFMIGAYNEEVLEQMIKQALNLVSGQ
jgi:thiol-disulfide isomerase/thioredoxin